MPYVRLTPKERAESRRKAMEKSLETRRARSAVRGKMSYIKIPQTAIDHINAVAIAWGMTQVDAATRALMAVGFPTQQPTAQQGGQTE